MGKATKDADSDVEEKPKKRKKRRNSDGLYGLAHNNTRVFLGIAMGFYVAALGYFLFFPLLALFSAWMIYAQVMGDLDWIILGVSSLLLISSSAMSYRIFEITIPMPLGVKTEKSHTPKLVQFIEKNKEDYAKLKIDNVIFSDGFEVQFLKTPVFGFPLWSRNTLVIGLPMMLCLPADHFRMQLIRRLGQFSKRRNPVSNWMYQFHQILHDYEKVLEKDKAFDRQLFLLGLRVFISLVDQLAPYVNQLDELKADLYAMDQINHVDMVQGLEVEYLAQRFLEEFYQPKVQQYVEQNPTAAPFYCARMSTTVLKNLPKMNIKQWLMEAQNTAGENTKSKPLLIQRLKNIGYDDVVTKVAFNKEVAAQVLLGEAAYRAMKVVDLFWSKNTAEIWRKEAEIRRQDKAIIAELQKKGTESRLTFKEVMQYLNLKRKYSTEPVKLAFYRYFTGKLPKTV